MGKTCWLCEQKNHHVGSLILLTLMSTQPWESFTRTFLSSLKLICSTWAGMKLISTAGTQLRNFKKRYKDKAKLERKRSFSNCGKTFRTRQLKRCMLQLVRSCLSFCGPTV